MWATLVCDASGFAAEKSGLDHDMHDMHASLRSSENVRFKLESLES